jgi:hypothetical protein
LNSISYLSCIKSIGGWAFEDCKALTSINIDYRLTYIGQGAFEGCNNLTNINLNIINGGYLTYIGDSAFENCNKLLSIDLGYNVTYIGENAFKKCSNLTIKYKGKQYSNSDSTTFNQLLIDEGIATSDVWTF